MERYSRLTALEGIGTEGLQKLQDANVLVIGCGALGSMCAMQLAASGIGHLTIADFDTVSLSNLQRQFFFKEREIGQSKCSVLCRRIRELNSEIKVTQLCLEINDSNASIIFPEFDFIIDGSDNPATKYMTAKICNRLNVAYCIGGVRGYGGQVMSWTPGHTSYEDIYGPEASIGELKRPLPVLGSAAALTASVQVAECVKYITGGGQMLLDRLLIFDLLASSFKTMQA